MYLPASSAVVLVEPSLPENVGAVARAMNNFGVTELRLVNPCNHLAEEAICLAAHSESILRQAKVFDSLPDALTDRTFVVGTSARTRERFAAPIDLPRIQDSGLPAKGALGLVFGRESSGLSNEELACCDVTVKIPTYGETQSLNLAQAVVVLLYELSRELSHEPLANVNVENELASSAELEGLKRHLFEVLRLVGFLKEHQHETLWQSFSDLVGRARMNPGDVRLIRGFLRRTQNAMARKERE